MPNEPEQVVYKEEVEQADHEKLADTLVEATGELITKEHTIPAQNQDVITPPGTETALVEAPSQPEKRQSVGGWFNNWSRRQRGKIVGGPSHKFRELLKKRLKAKNPGAEIAEK
ncbi:hypothetical protein HYW46_06360 [Candidatus Daviesbacteria bacterium]|nr:hypothetical protein [Candidatus Daviesbacteria bacterium]